MSSMWRFRVAPLVCSLGVLGLVEPTLVRCAPVEHVVVTVPDCGRVSFRARERQQRLTIAMALSKARAVNPALRDADLARESARGDRVTAGLIPNPSVNVLGFSVNKHPTSELYQFVQPFETGGKRHKRVQVADLAVKISDLDYANADRQLTGQIRQAFIAVLKAISDVELASDTLKTFDETPSTGSSLRLSNERIDLNNELDKALLAVELAKHDLSELMAEPDIWETYDVDGGMKFVCDEFTLAQMEREAFANRPDWLSAESAVDRAVAALKLAESQRVWNVNAGPTLNHVEGVSNDGVGFVVGFQPQIFDRNQGEIRKAKAEVERARQARLRVQLSIQKDLRRVTDRYVINRRIVENFLSRYLKESKEALAQVQPDYSAGKITLTDYLDTLRAYRRIQFGYRSALADYLSTLSDINLICARDLAPLDGALTLPADLPASHCYTISPLSGPNRHPRTWSPAGFAGGGARR